MYLDTNVSGLPHLTKDYLSAKSNRKLLGFLFLDLLAECQVTDKLLLKVSPLLLWSSLPLAIFVFDVSMICLVFSLFSTSHFICFQPCLTLRSFNSALRNISLVHFCCLKLLLRIAVRIKFKVPLQNLSLSYLLKSSFATSHVHSNTLRSHGVSVLEGTRFMLSTSGLHVAVLLFINLRSHYAFLASPPIFLITALCQVTSFKKSTWITP